MMASLYSKERFRVEKDGFNLVYYHRHTGDKYRAKRVTIYDYVIEYPDGEKVRITRHFLNKFFKADKDNWKRKVKVVLSFNNKKTAGE